mgnify:CR=1 FL=1
MHRRGHGGLGVHRRTGEESLEVIAAAGEQHRLLHLGLDAVELDAGLDCSTRDRHAGEEAAAAHVPGREWAKTVVCLADGRPMLAMLPAHYQVNVTALKKLTKATWVRLATEHEMAGLYPDCDTGAMAPFGSLYGQDVYMDDSLLADTEIVFHAGTHADAMRMRLADFMKLVVLES